MSLDYAAQPDSAVGVRIVDKPEDLSALKQPGAAAAIWRREQPPAFQAWIDPLSPAVLPSARVTLPRAKVRSAAAQICRSCGTPEGPEREQFLDDVAALADVFGRLMKASYLRVRFDVITNNACRKFHIDAVRARLVCTYRGTGTQYGNAAPGEEPESIHTTPTSSPILIRGTLWPEQPKAALLHRSPPIEEKEETRLLLVLDPAEDPDRYA